MYCKFLVVLRRRTSLRLSKMLTQYSKKEGPSNSTGKATDSRTEALHLFTPSCFPKTQPIAPNDTHLRLREVRRRGAISDSDSESRNSCSSCTSIAYLAP